MQVTDEMVSHARASIIKSSGNTYFPSSAQMRAALEAAMASCKTLPAAEVLERMPIRLTHTPTRAR